MRKTSILILCLITFVTLDIGLEIPMIPKVEGSPSMLPSDGDAWTENDNATYPWKCSPTYPDTIEFVNTTSKVGSYSLKVNHTSATTYISFYLDIGAETNFSAYDVFTWYLKFDNSSSWNSEFIIGWYKDGAWSGAYKKWVLTNSIKLGEWCYGVHPLEGFADIGDSPTWEDRRFFCIQIGGVGSSDNSIVYVDGMHFATWEDVSETASVDETLLPNLYSFIERYKKTITISGTDYTSLYSMIPVNGSSYDYESLETETLGQTIFALCFAYDYTPIQFYLNEAQEVSTTLLQFQYLNESSKAHGGFYSYRTGSNFLGTAGATYLGWLLAGLSYYYHFSSDSTVKTSCDLLASHLMEDLWNDTNNWFDLSLSITTEEKSYSTYWASMPQGSCAVGLSMYYTHVTQNATVETILDKQLSKGLSLTTRHELTVSAVQIYEDEMYAWWGFLKAYEAFNNQTYYDEAKKALWLTRADYQHTNNGSCWATIQCMNCSDGFDGWGFACSLPLLFALYEYEQDNNYLELFENQILDLTPQILTGNNSITRKRQSGDDWVNWSYTPSNAFIIGALIGYYAETNKFQSPFILSTNEEITSASYSNDELKFTVNNTFGGSTSITKVYCGRSGKPKQVDGVLSWSYEDTDEILTLTVDHSSSQNIVVSWSLGSSGVYDFRVHVSKNTFPLMGAIVSVDGENATTDIFGDARFEVGYGFHDVTVFCDGQNQTREIFVSADQSVGFNFDVPFQMDRTIYIYIVIPLGFLIVIVVIFFLWGKK